MRVSIVSGPAKRKFASMPVMASGEKLARSSRKMRTSSSQSTSSNAKVTRPKDFASSASRAAPIFVRAASDIGGKAGALFEEDAHFVLPIDVVECESDETQGLRFLGFQSGADFRPCGFRYRGKSWRALRGRCALRPPNRRRRMRK